MPTWTLQPAEASAIDTYIRSDVSTGNYENDTILNAGYAPPNVNVSFTTLLKMDFSLGTNPPPPQATFKSATLTLYHTSRDAGANSTLYVYRCLRNFVENQATWNSYSTGNSWGTAGARNSTTDYYSVALGSIAQSTSEANGAKDITLNAAELQKMNSGIYNNYGFVIFLPYNASGTYHVYASSNNATSSYRPKIVVEWELGGGSGVAISPFFNFFKNFENPWKKKGGIWQPENGLATI